MNAKFLLFAISLAALTSCSSAYRSGQTPDDVYFSPTRTLEEKKQVVKKDEPAEQAYYETPEDRVIRIGINDYRYRYLDYDYNYDYSYNPYLYGYNYGYYYNPHYCTYPVYSNYVTAVPVLPTNTTPRKVNLASYNNGYNTVNTVTPNNRSIIAKPNKILPTKTTRYNNNNVTNTNNNISNNSSNNNDRNYVPANNNNSSTQSSSNNNSGSGASISRPSRKSN